MSADYDDPDFYVCPNHMATGGYESCCACGGWDEDDENYGRSCTESEEDKADDH